MVLWIFFSIPLGLIRAEKEINLTARKMQKLLGFEKYGQRTGQEPPLRPAAQGGDRPGLDEPGPKLLLLDEPAAGMNLQEKDDLVELIRWIRKEFKLTIWIIEHEMRLVMNLCEFIQVLDFGEIIAEGTAGRNPEEPPGD